MKQEDYTTLDGCKKLRAAVQNFWAKKLGADAPAVTFAMPYTACGTASIDDGCKRIEKNRYDLRSSMINGMPRGCVWRSGVGGQKGKFEYVGTTKEQPMGAHDASPTRRVRAAAQPKALAGAGGAA